MKVLRQPDGNDALSRVTVYVMLRLAIRSTEKLERDRHDQRMHLCEKKTEKKKSIFKKSHRVTIRRSQLQRYPCYTGDSYGSKRICEKIHRDFKRLTQTNLPMV